MDRWTSRDEWGDAKIDLLAKNLEFAIEKLAYYEDLEVRCGIIIGVTIEDLICSYERLEEKLKEMNNP